VPLHPVLADRLGQWQQKSSYRNPEDFVFPSIRSKGTLPVYASSFVADYLRPAAIKAGVKIEAGQRFGLHNLRHSLSNWLVNKAKIQPKTVQGILRHSKIQTTLDLYTQNDTDETRGCARTIPERRGSHREGAVMWVEMWVGVLGSIPSNLLKRMAGTTGLEPAASAVTGGRSPAGSRRIRRLGVRLSATVGFIGQRRLVFVQRFVQPSSPCRTRAKT
jgi:hypothetical protein